MWDSYSYSGGGLSPIVLTLGETQHRADPTPAKPRLLACPIWAPQHSLFSLSLCCPYKTGTFVPAIHLTWGPWVFILFCFPGTGLSSFSLLNWLCVKPTFYIFLPWRLTGRKLRQDRKRLGLSAKRPRLENQFSKHYLYDLRVIWGSELLFVPI